MLFFWEIGWIVPYSAGQSYSVLPLRFFPQILSSSATATITADFAAEEGNTAVPRHHKYYPATVRGARQLLSGCSQLPVPSARVPPAPLVLQLCSNRVLLSYEHQELPLCLLPHNQPCSPCSNPLLWGCSCPFLKVLSGGSSPHVLLNVPNQRHVLTLGVHPGPKIHFLHALEDGYKQSVSSPISRAALFPTHDEQVTLFYKNETISSLVKNFFHGPGSSNFYDHS